MQKKNEQMFGALAICLCLCPQPSIDDALLSALSDKLGDKTGRMERGDEGAYEDLFSFSCPKFVSPCAPDYDEPGSADHQESYKLQLSLFLNEVRQAAQLPTIRTYLALYSAIDAHKLAGFVETTPAAFHAQLQTLKHKAHARVWQGGEPLSGARGSSLCGLNFAVSDQLVHVSLNRPAKRYGKRARRGAAQQQPRRAPFPFPIFARRCACAPSVGACVCALRVQKSMRTAAPHHRGPLPTPRREAARGRGLAWNQQGGTPR